MGNDLKKLSLDELRDQWAIVWQKNAPERLGRKMLEISLFYKLHENETGGLPIEMKNHLDKLVKNFRQNPKCFKQRKTVLKPDTQLLRRYKGKQYIVTVKEVGFEYDGEIWSSLSKIANHITGSKWNGWAFFGIKKST